MKPCELNTEALKASAKKYGYDIKPIQVALYVAVGGGFLGKSYAEQPLSAYIDNRVGRLPYSKTAIENMRQTLIAVAEANGLDPDNLPPMPTLHNCGVF